MAAFPVNGARTTAGKAAGPFIGAFHDHGFLSAESRSNASGIMPVHRRMQREAGCPHERYDRSPFSCPSDQALGMYGPLPLACQEIIGNQNGVISRKQALAAGLGPDVIVRLVGSGRLRPMWRGVYSVFNAQSTRGAELWAAVLHAGPGAVLSHQTAAEMQGLSDEPSSLIHVTIPEARRVESVGGIVIHRSGRVQSARHPVLLPPRTRIEESVLDLVQQATTFDRAFAWAAVACQRRLTRADLIAIAMDDRKKLRWRAELADALTDVGKGVHTPLEFRYVRGVERPHGLPEARRQARVTRDGHNSYLDNYYDKYDLLVELDGAIAHPDDRRWADKHRDNAALAEGRGTFRYGWLDCTIWRCRTAMQVSTALRHRGWSGPLRPCGPGCFMITEASLRNPAGTSP